MTKQQVLRCGCFLSLLALLVAGASWLFYPKDNRYYGRTADQLANGLLAEAAHTVDVLFIGDSLAMYGTVAPQLWKDYGIPAYTYATPQQNMVKTRRMLLTALKRQSPKVIFLEVNGLYREIGDQEELADWLCAWIPLGRHHDNWKRIPLGELLRPVSYTTVHESKGYYLNMYQNAPKRVDYMDRDDPEYAPLPQAVKLLESVRDICRKQGIDLVLYSVPNANSWSRARHDAVRKVSGALELPYLDLNTQEVGIDWSRDCLDGGDHLNYLGAAKATAWLGEWLAQNMDLADRRGLDTYALWNRQVDSFFQTAEEALAKGLIAR